MLPTPSHLTRMPGLELLSPRNSESKIRSSRVRSADFPQSGSLPPFQISADSARSARRPRARNRSATQSREIRALTTKPFCDESVGLDRRSGAARTSNAQEFSSEPSLLIAPDFDEIGAPHPRTSPKRPASFERQVRAVLDAGVPVFSFIFGIPPKEILDECRAKKIVTIGTATTVEEAIAIERAGCRYRGRLRIRNRRASRIVPRSGRRVDDRNDRARSQDCRRCANSGRCSRRHRRCSRNRRRARSRRARRPARNRVSRL